MSTSSAKDEKPRLIGPAPKLARKPKKVAKKRTTTRKVVRRGAAKKRK